MRDRVVGWLLMVLVMVGSRDALGQGLERAHVPGEHWESREPRSLLLDAHALDALAEALGGRGCVVKEGWVVKSWGDQALRRDWASSAKPVISTLLFFAVAEGKLPSVDARIAEHGWKLKDKDQTMTFAHLANMISGYARPEPPGAAWAYNDYAIMLYQKTLFDHVFKEDANHVAATRLAPLELEDGLDFDPKRRRLKASVRDFARLGWFWLNQGYWRGKPVLDKSFFEKYQRPQVPSGLPVSREAETDDYLGIGTYGGGSSHFSAGGPGVYGFNWWFNAEVPGSGGRRTWPDAPPDAFMSIGVRGNCALMIPSRRLMVVAAEADWGEHRPGDPDSTTNRRIRLLLSALRREP